MTSSVLGLLPTVASAQNASGFLPLFAQSSGATHSWTGFYGGVTGGYGTGQAGISHIGITGGGSVTGAEGVVIPLPTPVPSTQSSFNIDGAMAAVQGGFVIQEGNFVIGAEADLSWSGIEGGYHPDLANPSSRLSQTIDRIGTVRGRVGYAFDRLLVYGTGGLAFASLRESWSNFNGTGGPDLTSRRRPQGWTVGGGAEYAINDRLSLKAEYLYVSLDKKTFVFNDPLQPPLAATVFSHSTFNMLRLGLNYKFY